MDRFTTHLAGFPRRFPVLPPLAHIGWLPGKRERIRAVFPTCNFSIVLAGHGDYRLRGRSFPVAGPMVLTQWPGEPMDYGPRETWDELYLIYEPVHAGWLRQAGLLSPARPCWPVGEVRRMRRAVDEMFSLARDAAPGTAERMDRLAIDAVVESLLGSDAPPRDRTDVAVTDLRRRIEAAPARPIDLGRIAAGHGLSATTLRRAWARSVGGTPARHAMRQRMLAAARELADGDAPVAAVAARAGFSDALHFSRRFRSAFGLAPTAYRQRWLRISRPPG